VPLRQPTRSRCDVLQGVRANAEGAQSRRTGIRPTGSEGPANAEAGVLEKGRRAHMPGGRMQLRPKQRKSKGA
jgi:hypothetical protein